MLLTPIVNVRFIEDEIFTGYFVNRNPFPRLAVKQNLVCARMSGNASLDCKSILILI